MATTPQDPDNDDPKPVDHNQNSFPVRETRSVAQEAYDKFGNYLGVTLNGQFHPRDARADTSIPSSSLTSPLYAEAAKALMQVQLMATDEQYTYHHLNKRQISRDYEGQPLGRLRAGITKFQADLEYNRARHEARQANNEVWQQFNQQRTDHLLGTVATFAEIEALQQQEVIEVHKWQVYTRETGYEDNRLHREADAARAHEYQMKKMELELQAAEADKDRQFQLDKQTFDMWKNLPNLLSEMETIRNPDQLVKETMALTQTAIEAFGNLGSGMSKEERDSITPLIQNAYKEALKLLRRGSRDA